MVDRIEEIAEELGRKKSFRLLGKHLTGLLLEKGVISDRACAECKIVNRGSPECCFICHVDKSNNVFGESIDIMIKGDHDQKNRCLRVAVQLGERIFMKRAEDDNPKWSAHKVFREEEKDIEAGVSWFLARSAGKHF